MKVEVVPRIRVLALLTSGLSKLAADLEAADTPAQRARAQREALDAFRTLLPDDEAHTLVRIISDGRVECRMCQKVVPRSRSDNGLCRECARQLRAVEVPQ